MSRDRLALLDYFFVLRPILFFPGWSTMLAGYLIVYKTSLYRLMIAESGIDYYQLVILMISFGLLMGSTFVINQLCDTESDHKNRKLFFIADVMIPVNTAFAEVLILAAAAVITGFYLSTRIGIVYLLFFLVTGVLYNYAPFSLKNRPWGSLVANAVMGGLAFAAGWLAVNPWHTKILQDIIPYICFNTALYFFTTFPDMEGDRAAGKKTLAVIFGHERVILFSSMLYLGGALSVVILKDMQAAVFYALSLPFFVRTVMTKEIPDSIRTTKFGIFFFALAICLKWPLYLIVMITGFFGTRIYYKKRFGISYPNFLGK